MPGRAMPLIKDQVYHVFNRSIEDRVTFGNKRELDRGLLASDYYRFTSQPVRLSILLAWAGSRREEVLEKMRQTFPRLVEIYAYCLMPNHFHFLVKQKTEGGISKFMSNFQNSYSRYYNTKTKRKGALFLNQFKAVRVGTDEQLKHVFRYIILNPYTAYLTKKVEELENYRGDCLGEYLNKEGGICTKEMIKSFFRERRDLLKFIYDQADYQRRLGDIKRLMLDEPDFS